MDLVRRTLLRSAGAGGALFAALAAGVLKPSAVLAADTGHAAFEAKETMAALKALGASNPSESKELMLTAPEIAENGAVVPVEVVSKLANTVSIAILVDKNPFPLSASFDLAENALPEVSVRLKLSQTSIVRAVAKTADGKFYTAQKEVKVTIGGCGG
jgi:sulfur-oxidizing protein SoxY